MIAGPRQLWRDIRQLALATKVMLELLAQAEPWEDEEEAEASSSTTNHRELQLSTQADDHG